MSSINSEICFDCEENQIDKEIIDTPEIFLLHKTPLEAKLNELSRAHGLVEVKQADLKNFFLLTLNLKTFDEFKQHKNWFLTRHFIPAFSVEFQRILLKSNNKDEFLKNW